MLKKSQPNFQLYAKKIEDQEKNGFLIKKTCIGFSSKKASGISAWLDAYDQQ